MNVLCPLTTPATLNVAPWAVIVPVLTVRSPLVFRVPPAFTARPPMPVTVTSPEVQVAVSVSSVAVPVRLIAPWLTSPLEPTKRVAPALTLVVPEPPIEATCFVPVAMLKVPLFCTATWVAGEVESVNGS